jgi:D-alanyl-lipoteichoic acid acyltransferase DltB (MBOAT superfamily)
MASFFFYAALKAPHLIAVLLLITTITYFTGIWIDRQQDLRTKQYLLWSGISANVLTLIGLKYLPFITQNLNILLKQIAPGTTVPVSKAIIAIGVSYFIFQAISYLIDIYLEIETPERHYGHFALYMAFFPKLLQGPIERGGDLLPQFKIPYVFNYDNLRGGMLLFAIGLLKKVVIADRLAMMVNPVFDNVHAYKGFPLLLATYYYSLQIYFDFSGYTDMALGTALMFNITLTQNFNNPYFATSIADFWRRWHISFSRWILDYIFKPLQMSWRNWGSWGAALALIITFTVSGIWHGASWGFVVWGVLHGIYMATSIIYKPYQKRIHKLLGINTKSFGYRCFSAFIIFNLVSIAWIFFRVSSISEAFYIIVNILVASYQSIYSISLHKTFMLLTTFEFNKPIVDNLIIIIMLYFVYLSEKHNIVTVILRKNIFIRWAYYYLLLFSLSIFSFTDNYKFIYFQF